MEEKVRWKFPVFFALCLAWASVSGCTLPAAQSTAAVKSTDLYWEAFSEPSAETGERLLRKSGGPWETALSKELDAGVFDENDRGKLRGIYEQRDWEPLFITSSFELSSEGERLLNRLNGLLDDGINPGPYKLDELNGNVRCLSALRSDAQSLRPLFQEVYTGLVQNHAFKDAQSPERIDFLLEQAQGIAATRPAASNLGRKIKDHYDSLFETAAAVEVRLARNLIRLAGDLGPHIHAAFPLDTYLAKGLVNELMDEIEPRSPHYEPLRRALINYRDLALEQDSRELSFRRTLRKGDSGEAVRRLQERLKMEGYYRGEAHGSYDEATYEAVSAFQKQHLLAEDGVVGPQTRERLNVTFMEKARMIAHSLDLLRRSHTNEYERFIRINVPQFTLEYYKDGELQASHRVIVGSTSTLNQTPSFVSAVRRLVFNPNWYISERIRLELGDDLDPSKGYIKMSSVYSSGEPRIAQLPGPSNPLGQVKFEFPNSYAVFVHDTPKKHLFKRARRAFSHGCIRLENALDFAGLLLQDDGNSAAEKIDRYTGRRRQVFVELNEPVPIVVEYVPVSSNASGSVVFCGDPYQRSRKALDQVPEILFTKPHHRGRGHGCDGSTSDV